jgi:tetratricopeptide (TPR) repeat protein
LNLLRNRNPVAFTDPRVDLAEAEADAAVSDFRGQLAAATRAKTHAEAQDSGLLIADARMETGDAEHMLDNWDEALRMWRLAGQGYESIGDHGGMVNALNHQAELAWQKDDGATATKLLEGAMALSKSIGDQAGVAYSLSRLGNIRLYSGKRHVQDPSVALGMFRQAAAIYHKTGNQAEEGHILSLFGDEYMVLCRYEEARKYYNKGIALSEAANDKSRIANRLLDLGLVAAAEGQNQDAERYFRQSTQSYEAMGQKDRVAIVRKCLAGILFQQGKIDQAEQMIEDSLASLKLIGRRMQVYEARRDLIRFEMDRNPANAEALARENLDLSKIVGRVGSSGDPSAYAQLAEAEARQGKSTEAKQEIEQAFAPGDASMSDEYMVEMNMARAYVDMFDEDFADASATLQRARKLTRAHGQVYLDLECRLALAELHSRRYGKSALPELDSLKRDAERQGYGIFPIQIETFLHAKMPPQPVEMASAKHST